MTREQMCRALRIDETISELNRKVQKVENALQDAVIGITFNIRTSTALYEVSLDDSLQINMHNILLQLKDELNNSRESFTKEFEEI